MEKPRPTPDVRFVFHPEADTSYRHFEGHELAPFAAGVTAVTRANAWWLAESALLTYWDPAVAIGRFAGAGLAATFVEQADTQAYVAASLDAVLVCFRGTQPGRLGDIVDDIVIPLVPWTHDAHGFVHLGFSNALERVWSKLVAVVEPLAKTRSVWFGGHSLGAALATLAADRYEKTAGVCTLGSPRVGDPIFAAHFNTKFGERSLRYVNDTDIVTHVPPPLPLPYEHVKSLRHINADGHVTTQTPSSEHFLPQVFGSTKHLREVCDGLQSGALTIAPDFLLDHMPRAYTVDIWNDFDARGPL
jgi:triacylglycerol lipase